MRICLILLSLALSGFLGCAAATGVAYPTGYSTPAAMATPLSKSINMGLLTGCTNETTSLNCLAVYTNGSAGDGLTLCDGTTKLKIYRSPSTTLYTVQKYTVATNAITCNQTDGGTLSVDCTAGDGTCVVTLAGSWSQCDLAAAQTARVVVY